MIAKFMFTALFILAFVPGIVRAEKIPQDFSNVEYFYVFGPQGDPLMGADDGRLELFIDIKSDEPEPLSIAIFDPDTGGKKDWLDPRDKTWDTVTKFTVYGQTLLEEEVIAQENDYQYITFGPYAKEQGLPVEGVYRFRLVVETISGNDANLFKFKLSPDSVEAFSYKITFRLAPNFGDKMYFYPQIAAGTRYISVENFDLDRNGGTSIIYDPVARRLGGLFSGAKYNITVPTCA